VGWSREVTLTYPENEEQISVKRPVLDWEDAGGATGYQVQISNTDSFDNVTPIDIEEAVSEYHIPDALTIRDTRYWRVRAINNGVPSDVWSETRSFEIIVSSAPQAVGVFDTKSYDSNSAPFNVSLLDTAAFVGLGGPGLISIDFTDPSTPVLLDSFKPSANGIYHTDLSGSFLYCIDSDADPRLRIIDVSDPSDLTEVGSSDSGIAGTGMLTTLGTTTISVEGSSLNFYDTENPSSISLSDTEDLLSEGWIPEIFNLCCHVIAEGAGLKIYSTYNPGLLGEYPLENVRHYFSGVSGVGNYVYAIHGHPDSSSEGIVILDCTDAGSPTLVKTFSDPDYLFLGALEVSRSYLFAGVLSSGKERIAVLDISNPASPVIAGFAEFEGGGWFEISGNYIVCPDYSSGKIYFIDLLPEE